MLRLFSKQVRFCRTLSNCYANLINKKENIQNFAGKNLFGYQMDGPGDIEDLGAQAFSSCLSIHQALLNAHRNFDKKNLLSSIELFDDLSNELCRAADWAEAIRNTVRPNSQLMQLACKVNDILAQHVNTLNADVNLYKLLLLLKAELDNTNLNKGAKQEYAALVDSLLHDFVIFHTKDVTDYDKIKDVDPYVSACNCVLMTEAHFRQQTNLQYKKDRQLLTALRNMLMMRLAQARLLGYKNYAEFALRSTMAGSVDSVERFLQEQQAKAVEVFKANPSLLLEPIPQTFVDSGVFFDCLQDFLQKFFRVKIDAFNNFDTQVCYTIVPYKYPADFVTLEVFDEGEVLGRIYIKFQRLVDEAAELPFASHYTIFGGKILKDQTRQTPEVMIYVRNAGLLNENNKISLNACETLMHELGHAFHAICYKYRFQHLSGTRCETDFSEIPSILMEYFLYDERFLSKLTDNYKEIIANRAKTKQVNLVEQVALASADLELHKYSDTGAPPPMKAIVREAFARVNLLNLFDNDMFLRFASMSHLIQYGSKMYAYLWSDNCARGIFERFEKIDVSQSGPAIRKNLYELGAVYKGAEILKNIKL